MTLFSTNLSFNFCILSLWNGFRFEIWILRLCNALNYYYFINCNNVHNAQIQIEAALFASIKKIIINVYSVNLDCFSALFTLANENSTNSSGGSKLIYMYFMNHYHFVHFVLQLDVICHLFCSNSDIHMYMYIIILNNSFSFFNCMGFKTSELSAFFFVICAFIPWMPCNVLYIYIPRG